MQHLFVLDNAFVENQPHFSYTEYTFNSTYFYLLAKQKRYTSFFDESERPYTQCKPELIKLNKQGAMYCNADDEFMFLNYHATTANKGGLIDWA